MTFRMRVLQSLVLGLIGLTLILYTSLFSSPIQIYRLEPHTNHESLNSSIRLVNHTEMAKITNPVNTTVKNDTTTSTHTVDPKQATRKKKEADNSKSKSSAKGLLTKEIYNAGHIIPNAETCPELGKDMKLLVLITSSPNHTDQRMGIRQTWGHFGQRKDIGIAFVVGASTKSQVNDAISAEMDMYGDLIQARFIDAYDNLTLKTVSMLEWVDSYCSLVPFVLKTDDDMFINIPKLLAVTEKYKTSNRTVFGRLAKKWKPIRKSSSKYYVSVNLYPKAFFPDFTTGPAYLVTKDAVHDLYTTALSSTYLKLEDVFMTGVVAQSIGVKRVHVNEFYNKRIPYNVCNIRKAVSIHMVKYHEQFLLWEKLHDTRSKCEENQNEIIPYSAMEPPHRHMRPPYRPMRPPDRPYPEDRMYEYWRMMYEKDGGYQKAWEMQRARRANLRKNWEKRHPKEAKEREEWRKKHPKEAKMRDELSLRPFKEAMMRANWEKKHPREAAIKKEWEMKHAKQWRYRKYWQLAHRDEYKQYEYWKMGQPDRRVGRDDGDYYYRGYH